MFRLLSQQPICDPSGECALLRVVCRAAAAGAGGAAVAVVVAVAGSSAVAAECVYVPREHRGNSDRNRESII